MGRPIGATEMRISTLLECLMLGILTIEVIALVLIVVSFVSR